METDEWVDRVGRHLKARRLELGYKSMRQAAHAAGIADSNWGVYERGRRTVAHGVVTGPPEVSERVATSIAEALCWPDDALFRLMEGDDPATFESTAPGVPDELAGLPASLVLKLARATPEQLRMVENLLDGAVSQWDELIDLVAQRAAAILDLNT